MLREIQKKNLQKACSNFMPTVGGQSIYVMSMHILSFMVSYNKPKRQASNSYILFSKMEVGFYKSWDFEV